MALKEEEGYLLNKKHFFRAKFELREWSDLLSQAQPKTNTKTHTPIMSAKH